MCGINGIYSYKNICSKDIKILLNMNKEMHYRGPDESGIWENKNVAMGHVRLSIIGIENGHQPIFNENKNLVLICNGEIYNYKTLRKDLQQRGHKFYTDSDSEVIIHLFEEKGINCVEDLRGMFAFSIYNINTNKLYIVRDRAGKKPLYYSIDRNGVVFSSELKAIKKHYLNHISYNYDILKHSLRYSYPIELRNTHIKEIKRVKAGEYLEISEDGIKSTTYWKKENTYNFQGTFEEAKQETLRLLRESISLRLQSDVPIAILLSGGIDSSAIALLGKEHKNNLHAITVGYKGIHTCDERNLAKKLCEKYNITWHEIELDEQDFEKYFNEYLNFIDEPVCDVASIAQWGLYKKAKELGFKVLLSGNGGDEQFYGYGPHNLTGDNIELINEYKEYFLNNERTIKNQLTFFKKNKSKILKFIKTFTPYYFDRNFIYNYKKFNFLWKNNKEIHKEANINDYITNEKFAIDGVYSFLFNVWLQANCFYLSDRLGMAHSIEVRAPFSDHILINFIASLPLEYKYKEDNPKWFLKEVLKNIVPDEILYNNKKGFTPPFENINYITTHYKSKFFKTKLYDYNQVHIDRLLHLEENFEKSK